MRGNGVSEVRKSHESMVEFWLELRMLRRVDLPFAPEPVRMKNLPVRMPGALDQDLRDETRKESSSTSLFRIAVIGE
jgi:hypothetical protein